MANIPELKKKYKDESFPSILERWSKEPTLDEMIQSSNQKML